MSRKYAIPGHINCPTPVIAEILSDVTGTEILPTDVTAWFRAGELPGVEKGDDLKARLSMTLEQVMEGVDAGTLPPAKWLQRRQRKMERDSRPQA